MADTKLTGLTEQTVLAIDDWLYSVDKSDTTDDAAGSSRKFAYSTLLQYTLHGLTEISITGAATATIGRAHVCSGTTADYELALPAASGNEGKIISVRMSTALTKLVTLNANGTEKINGELTRVMWAGESAVLLCDGFNWFKIGGLSIPLYATAQCLVANCPNLAYNVNTLVPIATLVEEALTGLHVTTNGGALSFVRSGLYILTTSIQCKGDQLPIQVGFIIDELRKNNTVTIVNHSTTQSNTSANWGGTGTTSGQSLLAGDYIQPYPYQSTNTTGNGKLQQCFVSYVEVCKW